jgi:hypothetical protein
MARRMTVEQATEFIQRVPVRVQIGHQPAGPGEGSGPAEKRRPRDGMANQDPEPTPDEEEWAEVAGSEIESSAELDGRIVQTLVEGGIPLEMAEKFIAPRQQRWVTYQPSEA